MYLNLLIFILARLAVVNSEVIYAINCGGGEHVDANKIYYSDDPLNGEGIGIASDYGKHLLTIGRLQDPNDRALYETERYHTSTFGYDLPVETDGEYILHLKFCEVYFNEAHKKVFDVVLNSEHTVLSDLDIFANVGKGNAHDEYIQFSVLDGKLFWNGEESEIFDGKARLDFMKGNFDNPKCNAFILYKGDTLDSIPKLKDFQEIEQESEDERSKHQPEEDSSSNSRSRKTSGPKQPDPYSTEDPSSLMMPVLIAIACFIPLLFCLCKL